MTERATTVWGLIESAAEQHPDRVLFGDDYGRSLTAAQFRDAAERVAAGLAVIPGQLVSWQLPTALETPVVLAALARIGAVQNPLITILRERELGLITKQLSTSLLIVPRTWRRHSHEDMARSLGLPAVVLDFDGPPADDRLRLPVGDPSSLPPPPSDPNEIRWVYYSSGTTADPKGVRHTDTSVIASARAMTEYLGIADGDTYPVAWAYPHIGGATMTVAILQRGGRLVLFDAFDPETTAERMAAHRPTILGSAAPFFRAYLEAQRRDVGHDLFPRLRACTNGGAAIPTALVGELQQELGIDNILGSWGLTEFPCATSAATGDPVEKMTSTVGRPAPGVQVRVVDGELRLKGPQCFAGYVDQALDIAAFDADGWFRTGDLGSVDESGFVTVTGRIKDVIIRNAENISALDVERALLRHPDIVDVAVLGLPDLRTGERVCAVIVTDSGVAITVKDVAEHCLTQGLARHKTPEQVETVAELPRNAMGKILKHALHDRFRGCGGASAVD